MGDFEVFVELGWWFFGFEVVRVQLLEVI